MNHLKEYNSYNEGFFRKDSENDLIVKGIFNRIKETFDISNLNMMVFAYEYQLEETDSESGFIKLSIFDNSMGFSPFPFNPGEYILAIDDERIDCSYFLKRKIYKYLKDRWEERDDLRQQSNTKNFINKYSHLKEYNQFSIQEAWFDSTSKIPLFTKYDKYVKKIFTRVKDIFNIHELDGDTSDNLYKYRLEETSVDSGYIGFVLEKDITMK